MRMAMVGLGRMGGNMALRLMRGGHEIVAFNRTEEKTRELQAQGAVAALSLEEVVANLQPPRVVWVMVPAGEPTEQTVQSLAGLLDPGDVVVDGGNSNYRDSVRRAGELAARGVLFLDSGTSGGIWGLDNGYCLMVGGPREAYDLIVPALQTLGAEGGYAHVGPSGAGHFVKMVHNGIEYGMLQAFGEGFELLAAADEFSLDLHQISELWRHGSVVRSWLLDLLETAFAQEPDLASLDGYVEDSGEGRWTVLDAVERGVPMTAISHALFARFTSRTDNAFGMKVIAALRQAFGGHAVRRGDL
ncbi:MAG TPA: decarboxylating 6-phosphogluconate dehydrogenase [Actinomycetota bacterium]|nr:decarboxylating 6-phosphogluconate dehydrogenase [Actinomycetota bacterium]